MSFLDAAPDPKTRMLKFFLIAVLVVGALAGALGASQALPSSRPGWSRRYGRCSMS